MKIPVLLPKIFDFPLTYESGLNQNLKLGDIVEVPSGKKKEIGVIWKNISETKKNIKIRSIEKKIISQKINKKLINFIDWFALYNMAPKGKVLKMCLGSKDNIIENKKNFLPKIKKKKLSYKLNYEQQNALKYLESKGNNFNVAVLQGVTGSGKTLVYFERIKKILQNKKQVLVLLPEIFLTNQFKERFLDFFGYMPAVWHSKITKKNKREIWKGLISNRIKLIIGARSSLLLPFNNLGLIVVDEEHDQSYKQEEGLIYNARDMAISRASFENIPINLVSSIPSLETYNHIKNKKYFHTFIRKRFNSNPLAESKIINLNLQKLKKQEYLAEETLQIANEFLKKNDQVLFFLNRRGYSPFLVCKKCGYKHLCKNCSIYLTYHKTLNKVLCHQCGYQSSILKKCSIEDNNCDFVMYGPGVEKIFEELKIKFPLKKIKIFSSDYLSKKKEREDIFRQIKKNEINILVGTQMISKGFNFEKLNCIVVVDADFSGKGYDLRTTEKNIQLYNQLSGRAGRFSKTSIIIYQTLTPSHKTLKDLLLNNPEKFLEKELILREKNNLPPFCRLISLIISSTKKELSFQGAQEIKKKLLDIKELEVLGPVESPLFKIKKRYRTRLLLRTHKGSLIQKKLIRLIDNLKISTKIKLTVDVDPINFA